MPESHLFQNWTAEVLLAGNRGRTSSVGRALECIEGGCGFDHRVEPGVSNQAGTAGVPPATWLYVAGYSCHNYQLVTNNLHFHSGLLYQSWPPNSKHFETPGSNKYSGSNPLAPKRDQHQFSPNNIGRWTRVEVTRITQLITKGRTLWSWTKFSQLFLKRICMWIMGLKGLKELCHEIYQIQTVGTSSKLSEI